MRALYRCFGTIYLVSYTQYHPSRIIYHVSSIPYRLPSLRVYLSDRDRSDDGNGLPILAAVGQLQFDVVQYRLLNEYGVDSKVEPLDYTIARWANGGWAAVERADAEGKLFGVYIVQDRWRRPVLLFRNPWKVTQLVGEVEYLQLEPWAMPPSEIL